jgi:prepilin-type N-terminal cleavage/methylation domain-containing protein
MNTLSLLPATGTQSTPRRGFNLVELAIVVAVIGLLLGGVFIAASTVYENNRQTRALSQILQLVQNVRNLYAGASITTQATQADLLNMNVIPSDMITGTSVVNPWGNNAVNVAVSSTSSTLTVTNYGSISQQGCVSLAVKLSQSAEGYGLTGLNINGGSSVTTVLDPVAARTQCSNSGNANYLNMTFNIR